MADRQREREKRTQGVWQKKETCRKKEAEESRIQRENGREKDRDR